MSLFGGLGTSTTTAAAPSLFGTAASAPTTSTPSLFGSTATVPASSLFGGTSAAPTTSAPSNLFGTTPVPATSAPGNPFPSLGGTATSTAATPVSTSLYPSLSAAATSITAASAPSLFASAPATLSTGSLFSNSNSTAASNALSSAAGKNTFGASSTTATVPTAVALTPETIAGSTKYTELPADAKSTLDQFHLFLQGQIHLSATLTSRPSESLDKISKDTRELSKRLATLNDALERDTMVIQALQDKVGQELKQADSAGRIIEAYANTSHANFLYAGNNSAGQYFMDQCQSFEDQLRQFRSTIEEIERHLASFGIKYPHVSNALPEVMRNQHEGFLAVAGRVAALHDEIKDKEKAYLMFRRKFYDDNTDPFQANTKHRKTDNSNHAQNLRTSTRSLDDHRSFREIAKETLRPGNSSVAAPNASTAVAPAATAKPSLFGAPAAPAATMASGSSLFGAPAAPTVAAPTFSLSAAPPTSALSTGLFGAPAASTGMGLGGFKFGK